MTAAPACNELKRYSKGPAKNLFLFFITNKNKAVVKALWAFSDTKVRILL